MKTDPGAAVTEGISVLPACATFVSSFVCSTSAPQRVFLRLAFLAAAAACASGGLAVDGDMTSAILSQRVPFHKRRLVTLMDMLPYSSSNTLVTPGLAVGIAHCGPVAIALSLSRSHATCSSFASYLKQRH